MTVQTHTSTETSLFRYIPSLVALLVFAAFTAVREFYPLIYQSIMTLFVGMNGEPALNDFAVVLEAGKCWLHGQSVYGYSPCLHGYYNYAPLLLRIGYLPYDERFYMPAGLMVDAIFVVSLCLLPPPPSWGAVWMRTIAVISTASMSALGAANIDLLIFAFTIIGTLRLAGGVAGRCAGYFTFIMLAFAKFYPVALLVFVLREAAKPLLILTILFAVTGGAFAWIFYADIQIAANTVPGGLPFAWLFGAINLPFGILLLLFMPGKFTFHPQQTDYVAAMHHPGGLAFVSLAVNFLTLVSLVRAYQIRKRYAAAYQRLDSARQLLLLAGIAVFAFCFVETQNLDHRAIFLILAMPALEWITSHGAADVAVMARRMVMVILLLMSESFFRDLTAQEAVALLPNGPAITVQLALWFLREAAWWWLFTHFLAFGILFVQEQLVRLRASLPAVFRASIARRPQSK